MKQEPVKQIICSAWTPVGTVDQYIDQLEEKWIMSIQD